MNWGIELICLVIASLMLPWSAESKRGYNHFYNRYQYLGSKVDNSKEYYKDLGLSPEANEIEIRKAFKELARKWHPDKNPSAEANSRFVTINEAHSVLSDEKLRRQYDLRKKFANDENAADKSNVEQKTSIFSQKKGDEFKSMKEFYRRLNEAVKETRTEMNSLGYKIIRKVCFYGSLAAIVAIGPFYFFQLIPRRTPTKQ